MPKIRVGIFMGGRSIEREVSFNSGRTVCDHLDTSCYDVIPIYQTQSGTLYILPWHFLHRGKTSDFEHRLTNEAELIIWDDLPNHIDFMYIAMHGRYAEDGILQGTLELLGVPYMGSSILASAICMDKVIAKRFLASHGIAVPHDIVLYPHEMKQITEKSVVKRLAEKNLDSPWVVKPYKEGSSLGISVVHDPKKLLQAIEHATTIDPQKIQTVLIEQHLQGMEFSCITLFDYTTNQFMPLLPTEIVTEAASDLFDYEQKYMPGRAKKFTPARCSANMISQIQQTCVRVMQLLDIKTISRIDGFVTTDNRIVIIDPNTSSGMAPSSFLFREAAAMKNMNHTQLINHLIETDLSRYGMLNTFKNKKSETSATNPKLRVAVLFGGPSQEREISLESGRNSIYKLSPQKYVVTPLFADKKMHLYQITNAQLVLNTTQEIIDSLQPEQNVSWQSLKTTFDFVFIGLHGGPGEDGSVQGMLEMLDVPYNGSSILASALCMDKYKTAQYLKAAGFETPSNFLIHHDEWNKSEKSVLKKITSKINPPFIVKPHDDGCSIMVQKVGNPQELSHAIETIFKQGKSSVLVEEYITGMELTVGVLGNEFPQALPPSQAVVHNAILSIEEKFLPGAGENITPAPLPKETLLAIQKTMEQVYKELGCAGYARIDCFYQSKQESPTNKERIILLEVNTLPALTPATCFFHQAAEVGMKPMECIDKIIEYGLAMHTTNQQPSIQKQTTATAIKQKTL